MVTRIYVVINGDEKRLVEAASAAQAIRHCVKNKYTAKPATPKELAALMQSGLSVEVVLTDSESSASAQDQNQP